MSQVVLTTIYNKLVAVQTAGTVYNLVGGKIYQLEGPQGDVMPLLVYAISNEDTTTFMSADSCTSATGSGVGCADRRFWSPISAFRPAPTEACCLRWKLRTHERSCGPRHEQSCRGSGLRSSLNVQVPP